MRDTRIFAHIGSDDQPKVTYLDVSAGVTIEIGTVYLFFENAAHAEHFITDCDQALTDMALAQALAARREDA